MNYNTQNAKIASITEKTLIVGCFPKASDHAVVFGCGTIGLAASITLKWLGGRIRADLRLFRAAS